MRLCVISGISFGFPKLFQSQGQVTHVLLTRSPLITQEQALKITVRLACVKHAASVRPEPGSNSPLMSKIPNPKTGKIHNHKVLQTRLSTNNQQKADHSSSTKGKTSPTQTHHHPQRATAPSEPTTKKLASIFDTLLSSQRSDAHHRRTQRVPRPGLYRRSLHQRRGNRSNLPASLLGRQIRLLSRAGRRRTRLDLGGSHTVAPIPGPAPIRCPKHSRCS